MATCGPYATFNFDSSPVIPSLPGAEGEFPGPCHESLSGHSAYELADATRKALESKGSSPGYVIPTGEPNHDLLQLPSTFAPLPAILLEPIPTLILSPDSTAECCSTFIQTSQSTEEYRSTVSIPQVEANAPAPALMSADGNVPVLRSSSRSPSPLLHNPLLRDSDEATTFSV